MLAILKRELKAYFYSPVAYVLIGAFFVISSLIFVEFCMFGPSYPNSDGSYSRTPIADISIVLNVMQTFLLLFTPIITMKLFAEEKRNGTEVLLITSPVNITKIVLGKFLSALILFLVITALTLIYIVIMFIFGKPYISSMMGSYLVFILFGGLFISIGTFISSLTENQVISVIVSILANAVIYLINQFQSNLGTILDKLIGAVSPISRTKNFNSGIFTLNDIIFFLVAIALFLFLTVRNIEKKRWSKG
jgi:ABC-2 type transport system permease protein